MVFHRFMSERNPLSIWLNGQVVKPWDPFLSNEAATQRLPTEVLGSPGDSLAVIPYVLPHHSRLSGEKHREAVAQGLMGPLLVVEGQISPNSLSGLSPILVCLQVHPPRT